MLWILKKKRVAIWSRFVNEFEVNCLFTQKLNMHNIKQRRITSKIFTLFKIEQDCIKTESKKFINNRTNSIIHLPALSQLGAAILDYFCASNFFLSFKKIFI